MFWIKARKEFSLLLSIFKYKSVLCLNSCKVGLSTVDINQGFTKYV